MPDLDEGRLGGEVAACHLVDDDHQSGAFAAELDAECLGAEPSGDLGEVDQVAGDDWHAGVAPAAGLRTTGLGRRLGGRIGRRIAAPKQFCVRRHQALLWSFVAVTDPTWCGHVWPGGGGQR